MAKVYRDSRSRGPGGWCPWVISYVGLDGRRHRERTDAATKAEATEILRRRLSEQAQARIAGARSTEQLRGVTLAEFVEREYLPYIVHRKTPQGQQTDRHIIKSLKRVFGSRRMRDVTSAMVQDYAQGRLTGRIGRAAKPATVNRELSCLSAIFRVAYKREFVTDNPVRRVEKFREDNFRLRFLTAREERLLLAAAPDYLRPIVVVALHTGMRKGELLSLVWQDVDRDNRIATVRATKTNKVRHIPLNDVAFKALYGLDRFVDSPYVFVNPETRSRWCDLKKAWDRHVEKALRRAGVPHFRFHDLRHTFASRLVQAGVPLNTVRELLGHSTMAMTLRYAHLAPSNLREAVAVLARKPTRRKNETAAV